MSKTHPAMKQAPPAGYSLDQPFKILVVDDEKPILKLLRGFLQSQGYQVETAEGGIKAIEMVRDKTFDLVLLDLRMPDLDGLETLREMKRIDDNPSVLIMTAHGTIETAVEAMKIGADDFLLKPLYLQALGILIERTMEYRKLKAECQFLREQVQAADEGANLVTNNKKMQQILALISKIAPLPSTVLIQGESGTGKELIARSIHRLSQRQDKRFVAINCGVIPVHLLESELFGYERGAFTGAESRKQGYFEAANGGTIFLDEISEMNVDIQVKLLRVIQERTFHRIGGRDEIKSNVRIITSTNRNLEEEVSEKRFRKDLYYRINVIKITVPPLRERPEDISLLSYYFLKKYANEFAKPVTSIAPTIMDRFLRYRWEGNVRELENTIERAVAVTNSSEISVRDLPPDFSEPNLPLPGEPELKPFQLAKQEFEIQYLKHILNRALGNMALASRLSDIPRQNLYNKLKKYGIERESFR